MAGPSRPILSPALSDRLAELKVRRGLRTGQELREVLNELAALPANLIARASHEIARSARLGWWDPRQAPIRVVPRGRFSFSLPTSWKVFERDRSGNDLPSERDLLKINPDYAWLFLFHPDGHVREAALKHVNEPPTSPFFLAALAWRLNDWVQPVRQAAKHCIQRIAPGVSAEIAVQTGLYLLSRRLIWGRWREEAGALDLIFAREDVLAALADRLRTQPSGQTAACLRNVLQHPGIDRHLPSLAAQAVQPSVRATAFQCLISGRARWQIGYDWIWIDKVYNLRKRIPAFETRDIRKNHAVAAYIADGILDRSALVRKIVADAMIVARSQIPNETDLVARLAKDPNAAVRARADFMLRHPPPLSIGKVSEA